MTESISRETARAVLALEMGENDANAKTIREYLTKLLVLVWEDREGFNGKRPFGNSGWENEIYAAIVKAGLVAGVLNDHEGLDEIEFSDEQFADRLVDAAIREMGRPS